MSLYCICESLYSWNYVTVCDRGCAAVKKKKKKTQTNGHGVLSNTMAFRVSGQLDQHSYRSGQWGANPDQHSFSHHQHYLLVGQGPTLRVVTWEMWTESLKSWCRSLILSEGSPILDCVGGKGKFPAVCITLTWGHWVRGNGNGALFWRWDRRLVSSWCQWLWSHGGTYRSLPVFLFCD